MKKRMIKSLAWAGGLIALALSATAARNAGLISADTVTRLVMGVTGLLLVWYGNGMPKNHVPVARARQVQRIGGWSMVLSGLVYAALWAFAPLNIAVTGGGAAVIAGLIVTIGYCVTLRRKAAA